MSDSGDKATNMERGILFAHLIEPTHVGAGEGLGTIDRPVFRESTTGYPTIPGSTLKGVTKAAAEADATTWDKDIARAAFGTSGDDGGNQGCMLWADFRLLFLPLRSLAGTFAWATSTLALARFLRALELVDTQCVGYRSLSAFLAANHLNTASDNAIVHDASTCLVVSGDTMVIEGFVLKAKPDESKPDAGGGIRQLRLFADWLTRAVFADNYWQSFFSDRIAVLPDDAFAHTCRNSLPVDANIKIDPKTGVTTTGSLRYTEFVPAETLMYSPLTILKPLTETVADLECVTDTWRDYAKTRPVLQFGADESKGKGVSQLAFLSKTSVDAEREEGAQS
jgi:CRISPR-associated protein Cmr4